MVADSTGGSGEQHRYARGGVVHPAPGGDDRVPAWLTRDCPAGTPPYDNGGELLPPGTVWLRNDTGRPLRPDEWHLLTVVPAPDRMFTARDVEQVTRDVIDRLIAGIAPDVDAGRTVPSSPKEQP